MTYCNKKLYSTEPYNTWIKEARKDFDTARKSLEYELLMSNKATLVNCIRILFCCRQLKNYQVLDENLAMMGNFCADPYFISSTLLNMIINKTEEEKILEYITQSIKATTNSNSELLYTSLIDVCLETNKIKIAYKLINEASKFIPSVTLFNLLYKHNQDKRACIKTLLDSSEQSLENIREHACIEYITLCRQNANYFEALNALQKHSSCFKDKNLAEGLRAALYTDTSKHYDAYKIYKNLPENIYTEHSDIFYTYTYTLHKLDQAERLHQLYSSYPNLLKEKSKTVLLFLDFFYSQYIQTPDTQNFSNLLSLSNRLYKFEYKENTPNQDILYVFLSYNAQFMCYKNKLKENILFVSSNYFSWYTLSPLIIINTIKKYITSKTKIFFIGSSQSGFGSLLLGSLMGQTCNNEIFILSFSPQTSIFPFSENVTQVSKAYLEFYDNVSNFRFCHDSAVAYGNINRFFLKKKENINAFIYVGEKMIYDMNEASAIKNFNTCHICAMPDFSMHNTLMFFYRDQEFFKNKIESLNKNSEEYNFYNRYNAYKSKYNYSLEDIISAALKKRALIFKEAQKV